MTYREQKLRIKAQEVIDLLKEYLPEYKEAFDLYNPDGEYDLQLDKEDEEWFNGGFRFILSDQNETYVLDIGCGGIFKVLTSNPSELIKVANYLDEEIAAQRTYENPWTWDDAIVEIKRQIEERKHEN